MPSDRIAESSGERLHPTSPIFGIGGAARRLLLPGLVVLFASGGRDLELWLMVLFVPVVAHAVVRYVTYRYRFEADELVIRQGLLTRSERHIPFARIQNIDLVQNPLHRWLNVAAVTLETAGGDEPEAKMQVLSLDAVGRMRARVFAGRARSSPIDASPEGGRAGTAAAGVASDDRTLLQLPGRELALYGVISNRGMAVVAAAVGLAWQLSGSDGAPNRLVRWFEPAAAEVRARLETAFGAGGASAATLLTVIAGVLILLLLIRGLSVVWALVKLHRFTLRRCGEDLRTSFGLLTRRSATLPRGRIQLVRVRETLLHRLFRRVEVRVETAGAGSEGGREEVGRQLVAPLLRREDLPGLLEEILPEHDPERLTWQPVSPRAWRRVCRRTVAGTIVAAAALTAIPAVPLWAGVGFLFGLLPVALLLARLGFREIAWAEAAAGVAYRDGWWIRRHSLTRFAKVQAVELRQSPFDRRNRMAGVRVDTAGARRIAHRIHIPYLDLPLARRLHARWAGEAGRREFRW